MKQVTEIAFVTCLIGGLSPALSQVASTTHEPPQTECDRQAASQVDPRRAAPPVPYTEMHSGLAVTACLDAVRIYPNSPRLKYQLGRAYEASGNIPKSIELFRETADLGHTAAQVELATAYLIGQGVPKDVEQARRLYQRASELGNPHAQYQIALSFIKAGEESIVAGQLGAYTSAITWLRKSAEQGNADAQFQLARFLITGLGGIIPDDAEAVKLLRSAAAQGHKGAKDALVEFDVKQDPEDIVAQVLNYSTFGDDKGRAQSFWYKEPSLNCSYREFVSARGRQERLSNLAVLAIASAGMKATDRLDFNEIDPRGLGFRVDRSGTYTTYDNNLLLYSSEQLDVGRLKRGWTLIFEKHCQGKKRQF